MRIRKAEELSPEDLQRRDKLILDNAKLATYWGSRWARKLGNHLILDADDMRQEAAMALIAAADSYDPNRGTTIGSHIMNHMQWHYPQLQQRLRYRTQSFKVVVDEREIDPRFNDRECLPDLRSIVPDYRSNLDYVSLDDREVAGIINQEIDKLEGRHMQTVMRMHTGIGHRKAYTIYEIGEILGVTGSRVDQIYAAGLTRMKFNLLDKKDDLT